MEALIHGTAKGQIAVSSSFGAGAAALLDLVTQIDPATPVVFVDTGKWFPETLAYRDRLTDHFDPSATHYAQPSPQSHKYWA